MYRAFCVYPLGRSGGIHLCRDKTDLEGDIIADIGDEGHAGDGEVIVRPLNRRLSAADQFIGAFQRRLDCEGRLPGCAGDGQVTRHLKFDAVANDDAADWQAADAGRLEGDELIGVGLGLEDEARH